MNNIGVDEDAIDTETLQAQINMSMSFAQNLVSSWIEPSHKLLRRSDRDIEAELKEYMRRPPRLGVGAPIPETSHSSREVARLRGQLIGKSDNKCSREEDDMKKGSSDEEEEESKSGVFKKKPRVDPFGDGSGKKKNKRQKKAILGTHTLAPTLATNPQQKTIEQPKLIGMATESNVDKADVPENSTDVLPTSTKSPKHLGGSLPTMSITPPSTRRLSQPVALLKQPLLRLDQHVSDGDSDNDVKTETPSKKKRKRHKKKKAPNPVGEAATRTS